MQELELSNRIAEYLNVIKTLERTSEHYLVEGELRESLDRCYKLAFKRLEEELNKARGKAFVVDISQLPKTEGFDIEKFLYYFDNTGIAFINTKEESK